MCGECGYPYTRVIWKNHGKAKAVWRSKNRLKNGPKSCNQSPSLIESVLHQAVVDAINKRFKATSLTDVIHPISEFNNILTYSMIKKYAIVRFQSFALASPSISKERSS